MRDSQSGFLTGLDARFGFTRGRAARWVNEDEKHRTLYHTGGAPQQGGDHSGRSAEWVGQRRSGIESQLNALVGFTRSGRPLPIAQRVLGGVYQHRMAALHFD
jgi:hypothetical protein